MARQIDAVYEQGILRPLEPLALAENQRVRLNIEETPARLTWTTPGPVNERREELQWLAKQSGPYAGEWVAIEGPTLVAHGEKLATVRAAAEAAGAKDPLFASVPRDKDLPFGGW
jgi:predicted DNA-binding antitoxin AbrB/MazE fold protein